MDTAVLATINHSVVIIEAVIGVVVVVLLVAIIVTSHRRKKAAAPKPPEAAPNYYADLQQQPAGRPDPFSTFASAATPSTTPVTAHAAAYPGDVAPADAPGAFTTAAQGSELSAAAAAAAMAQGSSPPAGTPAGWLPDPGGAPDTLRYWDGNAWTQHFAQRS
ncbi:MAG: DUF2510 domain-containing protein [Acidimicrobiales bacterium]